MTTFHFSKAQMDKVIASPKPTKTAKTDQDLKKLWATTRKDFEKLMSQLQRAQPSNVKYVGDPVYATRYEEAEAFVQAYMSKSLPTSFDVQEQGIAAVMFGGFDYWRSRVRKGCMHSLFDLWQEVEGAAFVIQAMVESLRWRRYYDGSLYKLQPAISFDQDDVPHQGEEVPLAPGGWADLRAWLGTLSEEAFGKAHAEAKSHVSEGSFLVKAALAYAFGERSWAREALESLDTNETSANVIKTGHKFCVLALGKDDLDLVLEKGAHTSKLPVDQIYQLVVNYEESAPRLIDAMWSRSAFEIPRKGKSKSTPAKIKEEVIAAICGVESIESARWLLEHIEQDGVWEAAEHYATHSLELLVQAMLEGSGEEPGAEAIQKLWPEHPSQHEAIRAAMSDAQRTKLEQCLAGDLVFEEANEDAPQEEDTVEEPASTQLAELLNAGLDFDTMYKKIATLIDSLEGEEQTRAIDTVYAHIQNETEAHIKKAHYYKWMNLALEGTEHPAQQLILWGMFGSANSKTIKNLLGCTTYLKNVELITLSGRYNKALPGTMLKACAAATHFHKLHTLELRQNELDPKLGKAFASGGLQRNVRRLDLTATKTKPGTYKEMFAPGAWPNLEELHATFPVTSARSDELLDALAASDVIELTTLEVNAAEAETFTRFLESKAASKLEHLHIKFLADQELIEALASSEAMNRLHTFGFYLFDHADIDLNVLWESGRFESLKTLSVHVLSLDTMREVFTSSHLGGLETLHLTNTWFENKEGASDTFIAHGQFPNLKHLSFEFEVSSAGLADVLCEGHYPLLEHLAHKRAMSDEDIDRVIAEHKTPHLARIYCPFIHYTARQKVDLNRVFGRELFD